MNLFKRAKVWIVFYIKRNIRRLLHSGIILENKFYRNTLYKKALKKISDLEKKNRGNLFYPLALEIELTNLCNLNCVFCPNSIHDRKRGVMKLDTFKRIIREAKSFKMPYLIISGFGEAFLDKGIKEKLEYLSQNKPDFVELVTNGYALTKDIICFIINKKVIDKIDISIDAADEEVYKKIHGKEGLEDIVKNILFLQSMKRKQKLAIPLVSIRFKDFSLNNGRFKHFLHRFNPIADDIYTYANIFHWPGFKNNFTPVDKNHIIKLPCIDLWRGIRINWNGDIVLCCMDYEGKIVLGNILEKQLINIWNGPTIGFYRKKHKELKFNSLEICRDCDINTNFITPW